MTSMSSVPAVENAERCDACHRRWPAEDMHDAGWTGDGEFLHVCPDCCSVCKEGDR